MLYFGNICLFVLDNLTLHLKRPLSCCFFLQREVIETLVLFNIVRS